MNQHAADFRIYVADTDYGGVVHHANYLTFMERARTEWLRSLGYSLAELAKEKIHFIVRSVTIDYLKPTWLDDKIEIITKVVKIGRSSLTLAQSLIRDSNTLLATAEILLVCINSEFKPVSLPATLREKLTQP